MHGGVESDGNVLDVLTGKPQIGFTFFGHLDILIRAFFALLLFFLLFWRVGIGDGLIDQFVDPLDDVIAEVAVNLPVSVGQFVGVC